MALQVEAGVAAEAPITTAATAHEQRFPRVVAERLLVDARGILDDEWRPGRTDGGQPEVGAQPASALHRRRNGSGLRARDAPNRDAQEERRRSHRLEGNSKDS